MGRVCLAVVGRVCAGMARPAFRVWDIGAAGRVGPPFRGAGMEGVCSRGAGATLWRVERGSFSRENGWDCRGGGLLTAGRPVSPLQNRGRKESCTFSSRRVDTQASFRFKLPRPGQHRAASRPLPATSASVRHGRERGDRKAGPFLEAERLGWWVQPPTVGSSPSAARRSPHAPT